MSASQTPPGGPATTGPASSDPSMEDILASIRRILSEDEATADTAREKPAAPPAPETTESVLVLDASMLVEEQAAAPAPEAIAEAEASPAPEVPETPHPVEPEPIAPAMSDPPAVELDPAPELVAPEVAAAAASQVGSLLRTLAVSRSTQTHAGGPTIEDIVREELRPLLKDWLDAHLTPIVERLVRAEIERVVGRAVP